MSVKYEITTPKGIDVKIKRLQNLLFTKLWTSYTYDSYARSYQTKDGKQCGDHDCNNNFAYRSNHCLAPCSFRIFAVRELQMAIRLGNQSLRPVRLFSLQC